MGPKGEEKEKVKLEYIFPKGEVVISKQFSIPGYPSANASLEIKRSQELLSGREEGYLRQSGILVCDDGAIHECTLLGFESEPFKIPIWPFRCNYIDILLRKNEPVVRDSRDGLDWDYRFNKELQNFAEQELSKYIDEEKKKLDKKHVPVENAMIRKRFQKAIEKLNAIANIELKDIDKAGVGNQPGDMIPPNGFDFIPNYYHVIVGKKSTLTLKITTRAASDNNEINFASDSPNVRILTEKVDLNFKDDSLAVVHAYVEGKQIGAISKVTATLGNLHAEATIHVVASKSTHVPKPPGTRHRGMFREIVYDANATPFKG